MSSEFFHSAYERFVVVRDVVLFVMDSVGSAVDNEVLGGGGGGVVVVVLLVVETVVVVVFVGIEILFVVSET